MSTHLFDWRNATAEEKCVEYKRLDEQFKTPAISVLSHDNRCPIHGSLSPDENSRVEHRPLVQVSVVAETHSPPTKRVQFRAGWSDEDKIIVRSGDTGEEVGILIDKEGHLTLHGWDEDGEIFELVPRRACPNQDCREPDHTVSTRLDLFDRASHAAPWRPEQDPGA